MINIITSIRANQSAFLRHVILFFWILSISNSILFPAYTLSGKESATSNQMIVQVGKQASLSFLGLFIEMVVQSNSTDTLLADVQDEGLEKVDFIASRSVVLKKPDGIKNTNPPIHNYLRAESPEIATISPPPKRVNVVV
ncbi:MAG: hypothetical protein KF856_01210 [Cyclobacteriaceae bacterium]|nr:hypothetical protein [Cyclobacteriaceae bacterium]MBX2913866.1 hypothetical protein [Cyclobacteriaceae bacterium]